MNGSTSTTGPQNQPTGSPSPGILDQLLGALVPTQPGEGEKALATFAYFAMVIMTYYVIKPATRALMMSAVGGRNLTIGNFTTALIIGLTVMLFDFLAARFRRARLVAVVTGICALILILIWAGLRLGLDGWPGIILTLSFFVFADIYSVLGVTLFWSFCHDIFTPGEGKRLYGVIGGGGALGGILGGFVAGKLSVHPMVGTANLPLVALLPLSLTIVLAYVLERRFMTGLPASSDDVEKPGGKNPAGKGKSGSSAGIEGLRLIAGSRYLKVMIGLLAAILLGSLIVETQFNMTVEKSITDTDQRSSFMGYRDTQLTVIQFLSQVLLTGILVQWLGLMGVLLIFPVGNLLMGLMFVSSPTLAMANWAKIFDGAMKYGTNQVTKEMLYLPTPTAVKYQAKAFIDVFFHRIAKGAAAALVWVMTSQMGISETGLFQPLVVTVLIWCGLVFMIGRLYRRTVTERLHELFGDENQLDGLPGREDARANLADALACEPCDQAQVRAAALDLFATQPQVSPMHGTLSRAFAGSGREGPALAVEWLSLNLPSNLTPLSSLMGPVFPSARQRALLIRGCLPD